MPLSSPDTSGKACALMVLTPIRQGEEAHLRAYLEALDADGSPLACLGRTHFARWVVVPDLVAEPDQRHEDRLGCQYLVFTSCFDGPTDSYLDELCDRLRDEAREIWGRCAGLEEDATAAQLKAYLLHNRIRTGFFVAAYPEATADDVREALRTRERIAAFAVRAQELDDAQLQRAFVEEFA